MTRRWVPGALVALSLIPLFGGTARLVELLGGPELIPTDLRFAASPVPLVVHIVAAIGYALVGAFQFSAGIRRRRPAGTAAPGACSRRSGWRSRSRGCG